MALGGQCFQLWESLILCRRAEVAGSLVSCGRAGFYVVGQGTGSGVAGGFRRAVF